MIDVNDTIDLNFPVRFVENGEKREASFSELITRPTVVSVYMRNNTSSCDKQAKQLQVIAKELDTAGFGIIALSKDTPGSHLKYASKHELSFPLVSDPEHAFAKATQSLVEKKMYGKTFLGPTRSAYLIEPGGKVLGVVEKVDSAAHGQQLRELVGS
ncbi:redoxin domain-containing protein [Pelagicoccus enzymogenes]|uniref:peroxiredoxin n=1 Tax=Pelagicoccus enzymogenes TaxID=2773457 RepID=UPI00280F2357|nr:redoxin domain-containing protein [Pelagicoccus enzymogenes]MDQ8199135.1 redoxin domain-containing protein [Pelagicoccus enzymogenes]